MSIGPGYGSPQNKIEEALMTAEHWMLKAHEWQERAEVAERERDALRQLLASISQRIVKALYDDPVERKGIATVIDAALLAGKEKP